MRVYPRYTAFDLTSATRRASSQLTEGQRLEDLESHVALNPELGSNEEEEEAEADY